MPFDYMSPTNYHRTREELLRFWLFAMFVAGKRAYQTAIKLDAFEMLIPFSEMVKGPGKASIEAALRAVKMGKYGLLVEGVYETGLCLAAFPDWLSTRPLEVLLETRGVGDKSARFFLLHSRPGVRVAVLDTHILAWLGLCGVTVPKRTPTHAQYLELEQAFLAQADARRLTPAELDIAIWRERTLSAPKEATA